MSIFVASTKSITRSKGQSAVASASYRAGETLKDDRYGKTHNYSKRSGVLSTKIILPTALKSNDIVVEREKIWNDAERAEKRKDSRVAREWLVNLPYELEQDERQNLAHEFSQELADRYNVIADCAIHQPTKKEVERGADARNFHAHIMLTTRQVDLDNDNQIVLTEKSTAELSDKKRKSMGLGRMSEEVKEIRQLWERVANAKLSKHEIDLIDSRSYKDRGLDIEPQLKMGSVATKLERDGKKTIRGEINNAIAERNKLVSKLTSSQEQSATSEDSIIIKNRIDSESEQNNDEIREAIKRTNAGTRKTEKNIKWSSTRNSYLVKRVDASQRQIDRRRKNTAWANQRAERVNKIVNDSERQIKESKRAIDQSSYVLVSRTGTKQPSPFNIRTSIDSRERAVKQFAEQAEFFDSETKYSNSNAQYREPEIVAVSQAVSDLINKTSVQLVNRHHSNDYTEAQLKLLDKFAEDNELTSRDVRQDIAKIKEFLKDGDKVQSNKHIINIIRDPANNPVNEAEADAIIQNDIQQTSKGNKNPSPSSTNATRRKPGW